MSLSFLSCSELESKAACHAALSKSEITDTITIFSYSYEKVKNSEVSSLKHLFFFLVFTVHKPDPTQALPCDIQKLCTSS